MILALTGDNALGNNGKLVVWNENDMVNFKNYTVGESVVMGRKTWESLGKKPLKLRTNYILTSQESHSDHPDVIFIKSLEEAPSNSIVIGGKSVYEEALEKDLIDEISLTKFWMVRDEPADVYLNLDKTLIMSQKFKQTGYTKLDFNVDNFIFRRIRTIVEEGKTHEF